MNYPRVVLAALGAMVAYFSLGALFFTRPSMRSAFVKYSTVYRSQEEMKTVMPIGMVGIVIGLIYRSVAP